MVRDDFTSNKTFLYVLMGIVVFVAILVAVTSLLGQEGQGFYPLRAGDPAPVDGLLFYDTGSDSTGIARVLYLQAMAPVWAETIQSLEREVALADHQLRLASRLDSLYREEIAFLDERLTASRRQSVLSLLGLDIPIGPLIFAAGIGTAWIASEIVKNTR